MSVSKKIKNQKSSPVKPGSIIRSKVQSSKSASKKELVKKTAVKQKAEKKETKAKTVKSKAGLKIDVFDTKGQVVESIDLPKEIFGKEINKQLIKQAVRVYLANQRKGTASTKTRGQVTGSSRKIYKQKGTGRARHGSIRAPIFVHGGVVFGPKPRDYSLEMPKKMKKAALFCALSSKAKDGKIKAIKGLEKIDPKTKLMAGILKKLDLTDQKVLLVLPEKQEGIKRGMRNIQNIDLRLVGQLNTYEVLKYAQLLFLVDSIEVLKKTLSKGE